LSERAYAPKRPDGGPREIVVFSILRDSACAKCGDEIGGEGRFPRVEGERVLCLPGADLDHFDREAVELAVRAHVRHEHTPYDELLARGVEREDARVTVRARVEEVVERWRAA